jgi:hypothetical protein
VCSVPGWRRLSSDRTGGDRLEQGLRRLSSAQSGGGCLVPSLEEAV